MIVVQTRTSASPSAKSAMTAANSPSGIWPCPHEYARIGDQLTDRVGDEPDAPHAVVEEVHLPAAVHLSQDGLAHEIVGRLGEIRLDGQALFGRRVDRRDVANPGHRHVQRPGNRGGRQREDVHLAAQLLHPLLVPDAEAVLLVDDHEAKVLEADVLLDEAVGADDDVGLPALELAHDQVLVAISPKPREHLYRHRVRFEALAEGVVVLLGEDGRRDKHGDLLAAHDGLERGSERDLGLAVADIAAHEPVHGGGALEVLLHFGNRGVLVGRFDVGERVLHLALPGRVGSVREAGRRLPLRIEGEEIDGQLLG